jgi:hypothetical protein
LREALAACREGDLVVTKLDRPARSLPDARAIADELFISVAGSPYGIECLIFRSLTDCIDVAQSRVVAGHVSRVVRSLKWSVLRIFVRQGQATVPACPILKESKL